MAKSLPLAKQFQSDCGSATENLTTPRFVCISHFPPSLSLTLIAVQVFSKSSAFILRPHPINNQDTNGTDTAGRKDGVFNVKDVVAR